MVKIRLMRIGARKQPFYRVVAVDERSKRNGEYLELLGTYNPLTEPKEVKLKQDRIDFWVKQGAQLSVGFLRIIGKAPQRMPRKPKKVKNEPSAQSTPAPEAKTEENSQRLEEPQSAGESLEQKNEAVETKTQTTEDAQSGTTEVPEVANETSNVEGEGQE